MQNYTDKILILEAKIELSEEKISAIREIIIDKKKRKDTLFKERDDLIHKKRLLQSEKYEGDVYINKGAISENIDELSNKIGEIIEESKSLSNFIQSKHDESQIEFKNKMNYIDELKTLQRDSNTKILEYKRKMSEIDTNLKQLRNKMNEIQVKLANDP